MTEHSILSPSSAARRVACAGSRALESLYPDDEQSPHAREGEAAHFAAARGIIEKPTHGNNLPVAWAPNGEMITDEMIEGAEVYRKHIFDVLNKLVGKLDLGYLVIEKRIDISTIHPDCFGTPDCWLFYGNDLHIWDYKFGHGYVEVFENWQLIEYAAGILEFIGINGITDRHTRVHFHIVQPRSYHRLGAIRSWEIIAADLRPYFNILRDAEAAAMHPGALCRPSPECTYCRGRHACQALQLSALSAVDVATSNGALELKPAQVGAELRILKRAADLLDARITGLSEQATSIVKRGGRIPHFKLEEVIGRERWKVPIEEVVALGEFFGQPLTKPAEAITPKQAIKAGIPESVIATYVERPRTGMKLVPDDGKAARKIFGGDK